MSISILILGIKQDTDLELCVPVVRYLEENGVICRFIFWCETGEIESNPVIMLARKYKFQHEIADEPADGAVKETLFKKISAVSESLNTAASGESAIKQGLHRGVNLAEIWNDWIRTAGPDISNKISPALNYCEYVKSSAEQQKPDVILFLENWTIESRLCATWAKQKKIRTVVLYEHTHQLSCALKQIIKSSKDFAISEDWMVLGPAIKDLLTQANVDPERIFVTGLPKFQESKDWSVKKKNKKGLFLLTLQDLPENELIIKQVIRIMSRFPEKLLLIRPHPRAVKSLSLASRVRIKLAKNVALSNPKMKLIDLIDRSEIVITGGSITGFEAILKDKPVIILNWASRFYLFNLIQEGAAIEVKEPAEFASAIHKVLNDPETQKFLGAGRKKMIEGYSPLPSCDSVQEIMRALQNSNRSSAFEGTLERGLVNVLDVAADRNAASDPGNAQM